MAAERAVVLLSGGLDSATALAWARTQGYECHALTVRYGQRHAAEIAAACGVAARAEVASHRVADLDLSWIGGSALTDPGIAVPTGPVEGIPVTYVPARNTVFLALALAWAETLEAAHLVVGVNAVDYSGYPDCRPAFVEAFEALANLATRAGVTGTRLTVHAPLIHLAKADIIRLGCSLGVDYGGTLSCYDPGPEATPCGQCDACRLRAQGFLEAGILDPALRLK